MTRKEIVEKLSELRTEHFKVKYVRKAEYRDRRHHEPKLRENIIKLQTVLRDIDNVINYDCRLEDVV